VVLCRILHLPVMLGYLIVGILIGPHALAWMPDVWDAASWPSSGGVSDVQYRPGIQSGAPDAMKRTVLVWAARRWW